MNYSDEKELFLEWYRQRYSSDERATSAFHNIIRIRESGISEEEILHGDEREICDRYFLSVDSGNKPSKSKTVHYRQALRLYRDYRGVTA